MERSCAEELTSAIENKFSDYSLSDNVETYWTSFRDKVYAASLETLGTTVRNKKDWFDENYSEVKVLLQEKNTLHRAFQNDPSSLSKKAAFNNIRSRYSLADVIVICHMSVLIACAVGRGKGGRGLMGMMMSLNNTPPVNFPSTCFLLRN